MGHIVIYLTPLKNRNRTATEIANELTEKIAPFANQFERINASVLKDGPPIGAAITVTLACDTDAIRNKATKSIIELLENNPSITDITTDSGTALNELKVICNRDALSELGLTPQDISQTIQWAYKGIAITRLRQGNEEIVYKLILSDQDRQTVDTINELEIYNRFGKLIPLKNLVSFEERNSAQVINHYKGKKSITIYAELKDKATTVKAVNDAIRDRLRPQLAEHPELSSYYGGEEQETAESLSSLYIAMVLALIGIYFILVCLFNSFTQPLLAMFIIPLSFIGVLIAFSLTNLPLSFPAMIGMVGLTGVVVNNSLVLITFLNRYAKHTGNLIENISYGATRRLRPILLTTITTTAGLLPTAYGYGGENPVVIPIVTAIAWGLVVSTILCLFLLPSLYIFQTKVMRYFSKTESANK